MPMISFRQRQVRASIRWKYVFHVLAWIAIFLVSQVVFFMGIADSAFFWRTNAINFMFCGIFYMNYLWLIRHYLELGAVCKYISINIVALIVAVTLMIGLYDILPLRPIFGTQHPYWPLLFKDSVVFILIILIAVAVHFSGKWHKAEEARKAAEMGRTAAELQHLRNQLNPHFLLNTLNNIYALIAFDGTRAQEAVLDLSTMLRYVLYENNTERTTLAKEIDFLQKYIALMKIRLSKEVDISMIIDVAQPEEVRIAPLIFVSLVENAFKHGISATNPSFIAISIKREADTLIFDCRNSNNPKDVYDHSGSGIGLKQVEQRLRLSYPNAHAWHHGVEDAGRTYRATITINLTTQSSF